MDGYAINYGSYLKIKNQIIKKFKIVGESQLAHRLKESKRI
jgi:hypothetical protein